MNQNPDGEEFGLAKWVARDDNINNEDIALWPCECPFVSSIYTSKLTKMLGFGVTHVSSPEDWPIMPVEFLRVYLKPSGFFDVSFYHVFVVAAYLACSYPASVTRVLMYLVQRTRNQEMRMRPWRMMLKECTSAKRRLSFPIESTASYHPDYPNFPQALKQIPGCNGK